MYVLLRHPVFVYLLMIFTAIQEEFISHCQTYFKGRKANILNVIFAIVTLQLCAKHSAKSLHMEPLNCGMHAFSQFSGIAFGPC